MQKHVFGALLASVVASGPALSHAVLETPEAAAGAGYRAVIRIGHGCDGEATHSLRVDLPEGFYNAKPMPKPGWTLETVKGGYATPFDNHGKPMTEGTRAVIWSGGDLADDWFDEFVIRGTVGPDVAPGTELFFPAVQECANAKAEWTDVSGNPEAAHPAPKLTVLAGKSSQEHAAPKPAAVRLGELTLGAAFSRATPPGAPVAGGFLTIANAGAEDRLVSASSPIAARTEIHEMAMQGDVMQMRQLTEGVAIPAGGTVELKPGGLHLMFMELKQPLVEGETVEVTLQFEHAGAVTLPLAIGPMASKAAMEKGGAHSGH